MAFQTTNQILQDGARRVVVQIGGVCDGGASGDEKLEKKVDASALSPAPRNLKFNRIDYNVSGGIVRLLRDADDPVTICDLSGTGFYDYESIRGLPSNADASETGNILLSTIGFDVGSSYSIKLDMLKKLKKSP